MPSGKGSYAHQRGRPPKKKINKKKKKDTTTRSKTRSRKWQSMREWRKIKRRKKKIDNIKNQINRKILLMKQGKTKKR